MTYIPMRKTLDGCCRMFAPAGLRIVSAITTVAGLLVVLGATGLSQEARPKGSLADLIRQAEKSVVLLDVEGERGEKLGMGSGFLIDEKGLIVTSNHVVDQAVKVTAKFRDGQKVTVKGPRAVDKKRDLAILELEKAPAAARPLALGPRTPPPVGEAVTAIGHPRGLEFSATDGIVSGIRKESDQAEKNAPKIKPADDTIWVQTSAALIPGNSGGPLLSEDGKVLGVNAFSSPQERIGFAVHVSHVIDLLARAKVEKTAEFTGEPLAGDVDDPFARYHSQISEMYGEYTSALQQWQLMMMQAKNPAIRTQILNNQNPGPKYAERFLQIADQKKLKVTGFQGLYFACLADETTGPATFLKQAIERLETDHIKDKGLRHAIPGLAGKNHTLVNAFLHKALEQSPHRETKATACLYLGLALRGQAKFDEAEVLALLKRCTGEFKDVKIEQEDAPDTTVAELAEPVVFEIEHLTVGKPAAEIIGADLDGKSFKLSDYRGKVVVLDFFADWCPYCVRMYPEEREMASAMATKPIAMLGVSCDSSNTLRQIVAEKKVTWRCWSDGRGGPIASKWQLNAFPLTFVIDHEGVIREKFVGMTQPGVLKDTVAKLVRKVPGYASIEQVGRLTGHATNETVECAAISADGARVLSGSADRTVILWDRATAKEIRRFGPAGGRVISAIFSPDGRRGLSAGEDKVIRLWDLSTGKLLREFKGHSEWVFSLAFSPDGRLFYSTSGGPDIWHDGKDSAVRVWDVETGKEIRRLEGHKGRVLCVAVSPDGRQVLTGGDTSLILWDASNGKIIRRIEGHIGMLACVSFLPDGKHAVSGSFDKTIRLWDVSTGMEKSSFTGHPKEVTWLAVSSDGGRLLSSDYNSHELRLWDLDKRQEITRVDLGKISPTRGSFSVDGRYAVWPGTEGTLTVYELPAPVHAKPLASSTKAAETKAPGAKPGKTAH